MPFQPTQVQFQVTTHIRQLTIACNSSSKGYSALFWLPQILNTHVHIYTPRHIHKTKNKRNSLCSVRRSSLIWKCVVQVKNTHGSKMSGQDVLRFKELSVASESPLTIGMSQPEEAGEET